VYHEQRSIRHLTCYCPETGTCLLTGPSGRAIMTLYQRKPPMSSFQFTSRDDAVAAVYDAAKLLVDCYNTDTMIDNYVDQETIDKLRFIINDISEGKIQ
jgi:hypothetical protein